LYLDSHCTGMVFDRNVLYRNPSKRTHAGAIAADARMTLILNHPDDLARNIWTGNLVLSEDEEIPPPEFVEAMTAYAGLAPAYRRALQGSDPQTVELYVLGEGVASQFDLPAEKRGVVQVLGEDVTRAKKGEVSLKFQKLDPFARYSLKVYTGQSQSLAAVGEGKLRFPMVGNIAATHGLELPESATGKELMEKGLTVEIKDKPGVAIITYKQIK
ncbi:MAG: hypothetical protein WCG22_08080, partial [Lentisphaerota bacterium]